MIFKNKKLNVAINGFGRIGRAAFKVMIERENLNVVAINDLTDTKTLANLLQRDSVYGYYDRKVSAVKDSLTVDRQKIPVFSEKEPSDLPWAMLKVDVVIEATGLFRTSELAGKHLMAGAKKVIISAPAKDDDIKSIVLGVNELDFTKEDKIVSMASCTTNCLSPVTEIIRQKFGIKKALMTTIHSYTSTQRLVDSPHKDLRRARAAAINIIPTTTGAAEATTKSIPKLKKKFDGIAVRVPTPVGSLCDAVYLLSKRTTAKNINKVLKAESLKMKYKGIVEVSDEPLVSSDIIGEPASVIVDTEMTRVIDGDLVKIISWYDNEWGYSNRLADLCEYVYKKKLI
ncbi:MAG: type I glyceraldehyde-3-phosphate dehydrogenase [bacterium]